MTKTTSNGVINENPDKEKWKLFVLQHEFGNIFQTPFMHQVYKNTPTNNSEVISLEDKDKNILGVLVYSILHEPGLKSKFSTRSIINGGPIVKNNNHDYAKALFEYYHQKIKKTNVIYTEVRNLFNVSPLHQSFLNARFEYVEHLTIHNDLTQSKEEMIEALHRGRWSNIKRALKKEIIIKQLTTEDEINQAHHLITDTYLRIHLPAPHPQLFLNTFKELGQHCYIVGAFVKEKLIGCRVYLIFNQQMYDWYAAIDRDYSNYQVADLLPWHMMLWGKENGIKIYDFAGAGKPNQEYSVRDYKLKFGGKLLSFGRYMLVHKPLLYNIGKTGLQLYKYIR